MRQITYYDPWKSLKQMRNDMADVFANSLLDPRSDQSSIVTSDWQPSVDIHEDKDAYVFTADVPGVDPKDIEVSMEDNVLTIKGGRHFEKSSEDQYARRERFEGVFYRRFSLPATVAADKISAKGKHGVLEIRVPKEDKIKARKIDVKVAE